MFHLKLEFSTLDALQEAVSLLNDNRPTTGTILTSVDTEKPAKATKAAAKKAETATATAAPLAAPATPAAVKGKAVKGVSVDELKAHILTFVQPTEGDKIKEFVRTFGVVKISDLSEAQRKEAYDGAAEYFGASESGEADPMD